jgi:hypothetical protein
MSKRKGGKNPSLCLIRGGGTSAGYEDEADVPDLRVVGSPLIRIPQEHQGLSFSRVRPTVGPIEVSRMLELAFAEEWALSNGGRTSGPEVLYSLLSPDPDDAKQDLVPRTGREWLIAQMTAASVIQWLGTSVGTGFLHKAFNRAGGRIEVKYPKVDEEA